MQERSKTISLCIVIGIILICSLVLAGEQKNEEILVNDNTTFAIELYQKLCDSDDNIFFSPYSISTALSMTYAGARGNTRKEMAKALRFTLDRDNLHATFAIIESKLSKIQKAGNVKLNVVNNLWPQKDYRILDEYLSLIKKHYGVSITPVDYIQATEVSRKMINKWVEEKTQDKIKDIIQSGMIDPLTRLVLVNSIYFKGNWKKKFKKSRTKDAPFYVSLNKSVKTPMMTQKQRFRYAEFRTLKILALPYAGNELSMIVLLPNKDVGLKQLEGNLTVENLRRWTDRLRERKLLVSLPKFKTTSMFKLDKTLISMGMVDAFNDDRANFAGINGSPKGLFIKPLVHKAFIVVNEYGTEAAAATAIVMKTKSIPYIPVFRADRPFIFLIQENKTRNILFMGRMNDPTKTGE
ncbi:MAG: serpin family protein [Desulfobacterales bacterium]|nr:serpin family protein [Desulfobacterales bacterium]